VPFNSTLRLCSGQRCVQDIAAALEGFPSSACLMADTSGPGYPLVVRGADAVASVVLRRASYGRFVLEIACGDLRDRLALRLLTAPAPDCRCYPLPGRKVFLTNLELYFQEIFY